MPGSSESASTRSFSCADPKETLLLPPCSHEGAACSFHCNSTLVLPAGGGNCTVSVVCIIVGMECTGPRVRQGQRGPDCSHGRQSISTPHTIKSSQILSSGKQEYVLIHTVLCVWTLIQKDFIINDSTDALPSLARSLAPGFLSSCIDYVIKDQHDWFCNLM